MIDQPVDGVETTTIGALLKRDGGEIKTGPFGTKLKAAEYSATGVPLISVGEIGYGTFTVHRSTPRIGPEIVSKLPEYVLRRGDIVFGRKGAVDRLAIVGESEEGWFLGSDGIRLRLPQSCDPKFVAYQLLSPRQRAWIIQHATGTTMASLNQKIIESVPLRLPALPEQRAVAALLSSLDAKIEANRRLNRTLEGIARAVFKSWFVDFDPVRARAVGSIPGGLDPATAALYPDHFEDSNLGPIPAGWSVEPLDKVADFLNGLALQKYPPVPGEPVLPVIKIAQLRAGHSVGADQASPAVPPAYVVEDGDLLFSWSGSLLADIWSGGRGALNQHLFKVTSTRFPRWLVYRWVLEHLPEFQAIAAGKATTMGHIQRKHLAQAQVVVPPSSIIAAADPVLGSLQQRQLQNAIESRTLAGLRDVLLPKLISGEVRVPA